MLYICTVLNARETPYFFRAGYGCSVGGKYSSGNNPMCVDVSKEGPVLAVHGPFATSVLDPKRKFDFPKERGAAHQNHLDLQR